MNSIKVLLSKIFIYEVILRNDLTQIVKNEYQI